MKRVLQFLGAALCAAALGPDAAVAARAPDLIEKAVEFGGPAARAFAAALQLPAGAAATVTFEVPRLPGESPVRTRATWDPRRSRLRIDGFMRDMTTGSPMRDGPVCEFGSSYFGVDEIDRMPGWKPVFLALSRVAAVPGGGYYTLDTRTLDVPLDGAQRAVLTLMRMNIEGAERRVLLIAFGPSVRSGTSCGKLGSAPKD